MDASSRKFHPIFSPVLLIPDDLIPDLLTIKADYLHSSARLHASPYNVEVGEFLALLLVP